MMRNKHTEYDQLFFQNREKLSEKRNIFGKPEKTNSNMTCDITSRKERDFFEVKRSKLKQKRRISEVAEDERG